MVILHSQASYLEVSHSLDVRLEAGLELLEAELLLRAEPVGASELSATELLGRDQNVADNLDHSVCGNTILHADTREGVDLDVNQTAVSSHINRQRVVLESSRKVDMPVTLRNTIESLSLDESIAVQNIVGNGLNSISIVRRSSRTWFTYVVKDQSLKVLAAVLAEQESVDSGAKLLEGEVGRSEQSTAGVIGAVVSVKKTSLTKSQLEGREL
jgi:hypothetical protein